MASAGTWFGVGEEGEVVVVVVVVVDVDVRPSMEDGLGGKCWSRKRGVGVVLVLVLVLEVANVVVLEEEVEIKGWIAVNDNSVQLARSRVEILQAVLGISGGGGPRICSPEELGCSAPVGAEVDGVGREVEEEEDEDLERLIVDASSSTRSDEQIEHERWLCSLLNVQR
jgi:hypothetical protein